MKPGAGEAKTFILSEEEARVAYAYLDDADGLSRAIADQVYDKTAEKELYRVRFEQQWPEANGQRIREALREDAPFLFTYEVPYEDRVALLGAFTLGAEQQEPTRAGVLVGLSEEQVVTIATTARDDLLALL